jgi:hypothetical protein
MDMTNETRRIGDFRIHRYNIIGTNLWVYDVYEPTAAPRIGNGFGHSTFTSNNMFSESKHAWFGKLGTRRLTPELDALPAMSAARSEAVQKFHNDQYDEAYRLIMEAFPEAAKGHRSMGSIEIQVGA